jgi:hypothetical protein
MSGANDAEYLSKESPTVSIKVMSEPGDDMGIYMITHTRGYMREYILVSHPPFPEGIPSGLDQIERICSELRMKLKILNLPTDQTPLVWDESENNCDEFLFAPSLRWFGRIIHSTERLSEGRVVGDLLARLIKLRAAEGIEPHLSEIVSAMELYGNCRVAEINALAAVGEASNAARAAGPAARASKSRKIREIVWRHVRIYWRKHPAYLNDAANTAQEIAVEVRAEMETAGVLPKSGRSAKTIAYDIGVGIRTGVFQNGHSGAANGQSGI